jgi:hypothetical protein
MSKITQAARGQSCVWCGRVGTVVLAHLNGPISYKLGRGMGQKCHDIFGAHLCHRCHDIADGRAKGEPVDMVEATLLTIKRLVDQGVLKWGK